MAEEIVSPSTPSSSSSISSNTTNALEQAKGVAIRTTPAVQEASDATGANDDNSAGTTVNTIDPVMLYQRHHLANVDSNSNAQNNSNNKNSATRGSNTVNDNSNRSAPSRSSPSFALCPPLSSLPLLPTAVKSHTASEPEPKPGPREDVVIDYDDYESEAMLFLAEILVQLHRYGCPSHRLENRLVKAARWFTLDINFFATPTAIWLSFGKPGRRGTSTHLIRIKDQSFNLHKVQMLEVVLQDVTLNKKSLKEGTQAIRDIVAMKPLYNRFINVLGMALTSASFGILYGGSWREVIVGVIMGLFAGALRVISTIKKFKRVGRLLNFFTAFGCYLIAWALFHCTGFIPQESLLVCTLAGIYIQLAGLALTISLTEIAMKNLVSGSARLMFFAGNILQLGVGVSLARAIASMIFMRTDIPPLVAAPYWTRFVVIPFATLSVLIWLQAHLKFMPISIIPSVLGYVATFFCNKWFSGYNVGAFAGATIISLISNIYGRVHKHGITMIPMYAGLLMLVPGSFGVKSIEAMLESNIDISIADIFIMLMTGISLTTGLLMGNLLFPPSKTKWL